MYTLYGIKNCDTIKKAKHWLDEHQINYVFHDYRTDGLTRNMLLEFIDVLSWQPLLNTRGTTWRKLTDAEKQAIVDADSAIMLMLNEPAIIKRPLIRNQQKMLLGFSDQSYQQFTAEGSS